jgi:hypothetical protein
VDEQHGLSAQVTDHPVESGKNTSDHVRALPATITIQGVISNTPVVLPADGVDQARTAQIQVEGPPVPLNGLFPGGIALPGVNIGGFATNLPRQRATVQGFDREFDRVLAARQSLELINAQGILVTIVTTFKTYYSMAFESISFQRNKDLGNAVTVSLQAKEVLVGQVNAAAVPAIQTTKADTGHKPTQPVEKEKAANRTLLHTLFGNEADGASIEEDL